MADKLGYTMLHLISSSKYLRLTVALILAITAGNEVYQSFEDIGAHHGIMVFAVFQALQACADIFAATEYANNN